MMKRTHNCEADSNKVMLCVYWATDEIIATEWGCRKCHKTWCTWQNPKKAEEERLLFWAERSSEIAQRRTDEENTCPGCGAAYVEGECLQCDGDGNPWDGHAALAALRR